jgi:bifunctional non-homologous end joining protein LigD
VRPELVAEIAFAEWTPDGHVRHASFQGLRADKAARDVTRERPAGSASEPVPKAVPPPEPRRASRVASAQRSRTRTA